jgi:hypothetical protein
VKANGQPRIDRNNGVRLRVPRYVKRHAYDTMTTATEYRRYAEECLVAMRAAMIPEVRAALSTAAQRWMALADQLEEEEALPAPVGRRRLHAGDAGAPARN